MKYNDVSEKSTDLLSMIVNDKAAISILHATHGSILQLMTHEALWIREIKPSINTKDEYKRRELTIRL